ncbi:hypothetical protein HYT26_01785 [Candidatus Pacearchaeota archaeon]|nr:hypothetical protein [Candidatus Pacearchaeota archaeon]
MIEKKQPKDMKLGELIDTLVRLKDTYIESMIDCPSHSVDAEAEESEVILDRTDLDNKMTTLQYHIRRKELISELNIREQLYKSAEELQIIR